MPTRPMPGSDRVGPARSGAARAGRAPARPNGTSSTRAVRWSRPGYALVLALLVVAPLLRPGYLLLRDAVSTPRSYLSDTALGLTSAPRATPQDFAVALASHRWSTAASWSRRCWCWGCGWRAGARPDWLRSRCPSAGAGGQFVAITLAIWNPYVAERLLQGHWSLLVGYGCLPWVATAMLGLRSGSGGAFFGLAFWIALAGLTPTGLMLAATVALVCVAAPGSGRPRWLCAAAALGVALVAALPWLTASVAGLVVERAHRRRRARGDRVRGARRARSRHARQPGQPRRDLERRGRTQFADNAFRGVVGRGAAGRGGGRTAGGGASSRGGAAAGAGGGVRAGAGRAGHRPRSARCCVRWWTPRPASVCCATGRSGWRWRCPDTRWPAPARW